ncbi:MAG: hypothetical protein ACJAYU_005445 [Bradymonadia bacterium]|jgi:hypothetical protein
MTRSLLSFLATSALIGTASVASAQEVDVDALWDQYDVQATEFDEKSAECDSGDRSTTRVNRICRESADLSVALSDTIDSLLAHDDQLTDEDRQLLIDGMLTNRQIAGALWVELGECETGRAILEPLTQHPDIAARPLVEQASQTWLDNANQCIADAQDPLVVAEAPSRTGPVVVLSTGLAIAAAGFVWDMSMLSTISEFNDADEACGESCAVDSEAGRALTRAQESINNAKPIIGVLYGVGGATAIAGVIWLAVQGGGNDEPSGNAEVRVMPTFSRGGAGAAVHIGF